MASTPTGPPDRQTVPVAYEHSANLPELLDQLSLSLLLSTYQAGRVVSLDSHQGQLRLAFAHFGPPEEGQIRCAAVDLSRYWR